MKKLVLSLFIMSIFTLSAKELAPENVEAAAVNSNPDVTISSSIKSSLLSKILSDYSLSGEPSLFREKIFYLESDKSMSDLSKILRAVSTMKGIQYYSTGEKKWETLYSEATFIDSPESKNPVDFSDYCLLEDHSLGTCVYKLTYFETENEIAVNFFLVEPIKLGPVKAVKPENLVINLVVLKENPEEPDKLTVYLNVKAKYVKLSLIEKRLNKSFERRIDSMYTWFENQLKNKQ